MYRKSINLPKALKFFFILLTHNLTEYLDSVINIIAMHEFTNGK